MFVVALVAARSRAASGGAPAITSRASKSWWWIAVQGIGFACAGIGQVRVTLDPYSATAIVEGLLVLVLVAGSIGLFDASSRAMGRNWALVAQTRHDHTLVTNGPFAIVRHPIYVALFLYMLALATALGHSRNLIVGVPLYAFGTWMRISHEERLLRDQFGAAYDAYAARVKRFVPGVF
ncbi:methyltransferase family protein [uncultured Sphingomonas sp.]|uniref:methyltransferase family protein n=1 Tax=uncultured Sphingomonas sp. TaxID=158754 RepID=UPI0035CB3BD9